MIADIILGLSFGDEGKGKVTNTLLKNGGYTHCVRFNGSHNAGHTIYKDGKKLVTHAIPTGVVQGVKSIIGPGCVVNTGLLEEEMKELEAAGIKVRELLFVDKRTNLITGMHLHEDSLDTKIGTTKRGNGPAYRDKYDRKGLRFEDGLRGIKSIDIYEEFFNTHPDAKVLFEGAQGFHLDIDWGDYPYVTSSHCTTAGAMLNGIPPQSVRKVIGVAKAYDTYVGAKQFEPDLQVLRDIRKIGQEFGATTGRPRQVNFLDITKLIKAVRINGATDLIINKVDILEQLDCWNIIIDNKTVNLGNKQTFMTVVKDTVEKNCKTIADVKFSFTPNDI
jgi:adenylosuccinate synthase